MQDNGTRLPTKEEILADVRERGKQRSVSADGNPSQIAIRPNQYTTTEDRRFNNERPGTSQQFEGRNRPYESDAGSPDGPNDTISARFGPFGRNDGSVNEYQQRPTTNATTSTSTSEQRTLKKSRFQFFQPYQQAIKESFNKQKKTATGKPKTARKVMSEAEARTLRDKLIKVILWQSEHMDELIIATTKGHYTIVIWSDIDKDDAGVIADYLLERARQNAEMAHIVREMTALLDRIELGLILVPRAYKTLMAYLERGFSIR